MSKAALLIDWENLLGRLNEDPWWIGDPAPLIPRIVTAVQSRTENGDPRMPLAYKGYFLQADRAVSGATAQNLTQLGFDRVGSTNAKNAADTRLIVKATRLQCEGYRRFYILTGDEDFADLALELEMAGCEAYLWPVDKTRLRGPIQDYPHKEYVSDAIDLLPGTPPSANELDQFILYLQRLIDAGSHLGSYPGTMEKLAERFGLADSGRNEILWGQIDAAGYLWEGKELVGGTSRRRRRLKYEHAKVKRLLELVDLMLDQIEYDHGSCDVGKLMGIVPAEFRATYAALPQMLVSSQHLTIAGSSVSFASRAPSLGVVRPLSRMILSTWHQSLMRPDREGVPPGLLAKRWVRHATRGAKNPKPEVEQRALTDGREVVKRTEAAGALLPVGGQGKPFGYIVNDGHPLVSDVSLVVAGILNLLPVDGSTVERRDLNELILASSHCIPIGPTSSDRRFWLGAMASEQVIRIFDGKVARGRNSPLARS